MKQIIYILLTTTMLGLMSCSDWLDVSPKTSIPTDKQFESESGFKDALTGIYLKLGTTTLYAGDLTYAYLDELAGLYSDYPGYNTNAVFDQSIVFDYENMFLSKKNGIYSTMYNIIANINNFLEYVDKNKDVLVTERYYETMKGEALGLRAFLHFDLLRMFGPVYKEHPALYTADYEPEGFAWTDTQDEQETVLAFVRRSMVSDSTSQDLLVIANFTPVVRKDFRMGVLEPGKYKEIFNTDAAHFGGQNILNEQQLSSEKVERNGCENSIVLDLPPLALTVYAYEPFTKLELEEIRIREEAELAAKAAQEQAWQAEQLKVKAEEEAQAALEAQKQAELAAKAAQQACEEAEKQAQEAEAAKLKIEQETKKKLAALKRRK